MLYEVITHDGPVDTPGDACEPVGLTFDDVHEGAENGDKYHDCGEKNRYFTSARDERLEENPRLLQVLDQFQNLV